MLKRFFILCSGADTDILSSCSQGEQNKYAGIGATVFFTAVMAFLAASYALYTVFDTILTSVFFGLLWGLLIFNLDRFIVSTLKKRETPGKEYLQALPRILLAVIIAVVISKPLELKIFEKEIDRVLLEEKNQMTLDNKEQIALQYTPAIETLKEEINTLNTQVQQKEKEVNSLYQTYISEAEGTAGTFKLGKGPVYKEKREKHDMALAELQTLREQNAAKIQQKEAQLASLTNAYDTRVSDSQPVIDGFDGLMARVNALGKLPWLPSFFIFMLFLSIETAPIFVKLLAPRGEYDLKLEDKESTLKTWVAQKEAQRKKNRQTEYTVDDTIYQDLKEDEELYTYKKKKAKALMQLQADAFYEHQKKNL